MKNVKNWKLFTESIFDKHLEELKSAIENGESILIVSEPGRGKDALAKQALEELGLSYLYVHDSYHLAELKTVIENNDKDYILLSDIDRIPEPILNRIDLSNSVIATSTSLNTESEYMFDTVLKY